MGRNDRWLLGDLFRALGGQRREHEPSGEPEAPASEQLRAACQVLVSDIGEASLRAVAARALDSYTQLDDAQKLDFFTHLLDRYGVETERLKDAYRAWEQTQDQRDLTELFAAVEPHRQQLLRRMNHAPDATLALVQMRADLRRLLRKHPELAPVDADFQHLLASWFNRGFLRMEEITWDSPREIHDHLVRYEKVHPMPRRRELRQRLQPKDRTIYAFFHPATGNVPLIFVEVALVKGIPSHISPLLHPDSSIAPTKADTAALYSINNALDGLAGVSFGNLLIKQVIDHAQAQLPHLENYVTLSPMPGFRRWFGAEAQRRAAAGDPRYAQLQQDLDSLGGRLGPEEDPAARSRLLGERPKLPKDTLADLRERLFPVLADYITHRRAQDGRPTDPVARFHLGNGASAWELQWPANPGTEAWRQSYGAMINYRYQPEELERRHEEFVRDRAVSLGPQLKQLLASPGTAFTHPENHTMKGNPLMSQPFASIYQQFLRRVEEDPHKALFILPEGQTVSYAQTLETVQRIAAQLIEDGVKPGDRVAMQVEKSPEAIALYLAALQIGAVFLPLNTAYTGKEMDYFISDATPRVLVCSPEAAADHQHRDSLVVETLGAQREGTLLRAEQGHTDVYPAGPEDLASILYTSGTTGRSKGAMLTHQNLASNCEALLQTWEYTAEDTLIHALPIFHIHGLFVAANMTLAAGASMHYLPKFDADQIIDLFPRATVLMGVPTFYTRLLKNQRLTAEACAGMRLFVSGSAPLLASDHQAFEQRTGHAILERYGMTETGMNATNPYTGGERKPGTVGKPFPGITIRVVDRESGKPVADGEVGLVEVHGPNVFSGYWQMPEKTAEEFREDGFFITGDLGRFDQDGYLCIVGRDKDLVISGGFNVYPKEVEECIDAHPQVQESAVIGVPHEDFGEAVVAVVVPAPGQAPESQEILDFISEDLARFKQPKAVRFVEALPRNVMGKVQKVALRQQFADLFTPADV
ncbi:AMP-binding protein [Nesterenkonia sphaerica]|uniref:Malonyl-CoA synthase n=1 Tax=Nesterenkonia sphaerica TaxID=1804988 RepID=A0A5R9AMC6_9MICC|nr:AMP-binding protein [Nesterenkonia sphaerica]TLP79961.1 malonyl-CoA synthase [Nesterenkonia sphaerica]